MRKEDFREIAEELAVQDLDEELERHPELLREKEHILKTKIGEYEAELEAKAKENERNMQVAGEVMHVWFNELPKEEQDKFKNEIDKVRETFLKEDFSEKLLGVLLNPNPTPLQKMLNLSDDFILSLFKKGQQLQEAGNHTDAISLYKFLLILNPFFIDLYHSLGYSIASLNDLDEAQQYYDFSIVLAPEDPKGYYLSALCNKFRKEEGNAKTLCQVGLELSSALPEWQKKFEELSKSLHQGG